MKTESDLLRVCIQAVPFVQMWAHNHGDGEKPNAIGQRLVGRMVAAIAKAKAEAKAEADGQDNLFEVTP
jgi:hypothetical protein